jgi:hypothetical protein
MPFSEHDSMSNLNEMVGDATRRLLLQLSGNNWHRTEGDQRQCRNLGKEKMPPPFIQQYC